MSTHTKTLTDLREAVFLACICGGTTDAVTASKPNPCPACMVWLRFMEPAKADQRTREIQHAKIEWRLKGSGQL
jgi:hypothetical protein